MSMLKSLKITMIKMMSMIKSKRCYSASEFSICCRVYSHTRRAPLTWTLRDRMIPCWGISTHTSSCCRMSGGIPSFSFLRWDRTVCVSHYNNLRFHDSVYLPIPQRNSQKTPNTSKSKFNKDRIKKKWYGKKQVDTKLCLCALKITFQTKRQKYTTIHHSSHEHSHFKPVIMNTFDKTIFQNKVSWCVMFRGKKVKSCIRF